MLEAGSEHRPFPRTARSLRHPRACCRPRGTTQVAKRLLRRICDFADVAGEEVIGLECARSALDELETDSTDLDARDRAILKELALLQKVCQKRSAGRVFHS